MNRAITWSGLGCVALLGAFMSNSSPVYADNVVTLDPGLKAYVKVSGVSGNVNSIGSDTLNNLMTLWARRISQTISQRQNSDRRQGFEHRSTGIDRRHGAVWADVPLDEKYRDRCLRKETQI